MRGDWVGGKKRKTEEDSTHSSYFDRKLRRQGGGE